MARRVAHGAMRFAAARGAALLALLIIPACGRAPGESPPGARPSEPILVLGLDGLEWRVVLPMLRAGELPVLSRLMSTGAYGKLETFQPTLSPLIWTSVVTGKTTAKHGIVDVLKEDDHGGRPRIYSASDRKTKALWDIFSESGLTVHSIGWWTTFPVEEIRGVMIPQLNLLFRFDPSGLGAFDAARARGFHGLAWPDELVGRVRSDALEADGAAIRIAEAIFGRFRHPHSDLGLHLLARMRWVITMDAIHIRLAREVIQERRPFDLMLFYVRGADVVAHAFWRFIAPAGFKYPPSKEELENYAGFVPAYYRYLDAAVGSLLEASGPGTTVIVLSDHGMEATHQDRPFSREYPNPESMSGNHENAPPGLFIASGPRIAPIPGLAFDPATLTYEMLPFIGSVYDVTPTILALKGLSVGKDMDGKILEAVISPSFLTLHPPSFVQSHDTRAWLESRTEHKLSPEEEEDRIEELRSLGYIN